MVAVFTLFLRMRVFATSFTINTLSFRIPRTSLVPVLPVGCGCSRLSPRVSLQGELFESTCRGGSPSIKQKIYPIFRSEGKFASVIFRYNGNLMRTTQGPATGTSERPVESRAAGLLVFRWWNTTGQQVNAEDSNADKAAIHFLMLKASYEPYHWTPPKGHIDTGETAVTTALRETKEETGLNEEDLDVLQDFERSLYYEARGKRKKTTYFLARLRDSGKEVKLSVEHTEFRWLSPEKAAKISGFQDFSAVIVDAENYINQYVLVKK